MTGGDLAIPLAHLVSRIVQLSGMESGINGHAMLRVVRGVRTGGGG